MKTVEARTSLLCGAALAGLLAVGLAPPVSAQESVATDVGTFDADTAAKLYPVKRPYSPWAGRNFPSRPFFGDTHLHTSFSMDAGAFGARLGPADAYRFAKGEEVMASSANRRSCRGRSISSSSRITPTIWVSSLISWQESLNFWPIRWGANGTT